MRGTLCRNIFLNVSGEKLNLLVYDHLDVEFRSLQLKFEYRAWRLLPLDVGHKNSTEFRISLKVDKDLLPTDTEYLFVRNIRQKQ